MKRIFLAALLSLFALLAPMLSANADSLGIGVTIMPDPDNPSVSSRNILWFGAESGEVASRTLRISSQSQEEQTVRFALLDLVIIDGEEFVDSDSVSERDSWLTYEPETLTLKPGETKEVTITVLVPEDAVETTTISYLRVAASLASLDVNDVGEGSRAVLPGGAAIDLETWIGVGDPQLLLPSFEMLNPRGVIRDGEKYIQSGFRNTGSIPLFITGGVTLNDQTFAGRTFGPYEYQVSGIESDETGTFEVRVPEEIQEGPWQIYVTARAGNVVENRIFTLNLTFVEEGQFQVEQLVLPALIILLVATLVFAMRLALSGRRERKANLEVASTEVASSPRFFEITQPKPISKSSSREAKPPRRESTPLPQRVRTLEKKTKPKSPVVSEFDLELDSWAESLRSSIREVRSDSTDLVEKYKDVPTRKPRKTKPKN